MPKYDYLQEQLKSKYKKLQVFSKLNRPVLFVFGTGRGLSPEMLQKCHFMLEPVYSFDEFNHLSVRSAAAIIFDRWLGINPRFIKEG